MREQERNTYYSQLPQVGELICHPALQELCNTCSRDLVTAIARSTIEELRVRIGQGTIDSSELGAAIADVHQMVVKKVNLALTPSLQSVINATGVLLQTNLGRAPLSAQALERVVDVAAGYCNLEFDLETGDRGKRGAEIERLVLHCLAVRQGIALESMAASTWALIVNNCAAATFLALQSLAEGGEVIVSRGELVEIGGGFRIPDILRKAGAVLCEVGTTNRTRISDYAAAITPATRLLLRVHRSNFSIEGFTEQATLAELLELGRRRSIPVFEDQGTGCAVHLEKYNIENQSIWPQSVTSGLDLVACSGDKLFGGPQCGILVGAPDIIDKIRRNPLYRAFRVDKLTYAALEGTLLEYLAGNESTLPLLRMLAAEPPALESRCRAVASSVRSSALDAEVIATESILGGGTTPGASVRSYAIALRHVDLTANALAAELRRFKPPVVGRVQKEQVLLDLRTVPEDLDDQLIRCLRSVSAGVASIRETEQTR